MAGNGTEKASVVRREFSKKSMEDKFGPFRAPKKETAKQNRKDRKDRYERRPLYKRHRSTSHWKRFMYQLGKPGSKHNWKSYLRSQAQLNKAAIEMIKGEEAILAAMGLGSGRQPGLLEEHFGIRLGQIKAKRQPKPTLEPRLEPKSEPEMKR